MYAFGNASETLIIRLVDGARIPVVEDNRDYRDAMAWVAAGNLIAPFAAPAPTGTDVDCERDRRIAAGALVTINGVAFTVQTRNETDFRNINGLVSKGIVMSMQGDNSTMSVRDADNVEHALTGAQLISMGDQVAARVQAIYASSWALKALETIPADYAADARWPE